jgi:multidrug efflux system outer membrane protein
MGRSIVALFLAASLAGCAVGPDYERPAVPAPETWRTAAEGAGSLADLTWSELFQDEALQSLIRVALEENKDLRLAAARVLEARAQLGVTRSEQLPQIGVTGSYDTRRASQVNFPNLPGVDTSKDFWKTTLDASFEIDLWGRLRRATEAARAELLASEEARRVVVITLVGEVAQSYFDLLDLDRELEIAKRTLASRRESLRIIRLREQEGLASELDLRRAEAELASTSAVIPDLERRIARVENGLSTLLGRNPGPIPRGTPLIVQDLPPAIPAGLPSDLLERRPDIRQAEQRLIATNARIGEAKAAFFPRIFLTGAFGVESVALSDLFTGPARIWQFGPTVTLPIFTGGRNRAQLGAAEARQEQALIQYQQTIQRGFREIEDALVAHRKTREVRVEQETLLTSAQRTLVLAQLRYVNGLASYLDVLDAQRQLFDAEIGLTRTQRSQLSAVVQVYKALGGGWTP